MVSRFSPGAFFDLIFHALFDKQAKTILITRKIFLMALSITWRLFLERLFKRAFFEDAFLESAFLESAFFEKYQEEIVKRINSI